MLYLLVVPACCWCNQFCICLWNLFAVEVLDCWICLIDTATVAPFQIVSKIAFFHCLLFHFSGFIWCLRLLYLYVVYVSNCCFCLLMYAHFGICLFDVSDCCCICLSMSSIIVSSYWYYLRLVYLLVVSDSLFMSLIVVFVSACWCLCENDTATVTPSHIVSESDQSHCSLLHFCASDWCLQLLHLLFDSMVVADLCVSLLKRRETKWSLDSLGGKPRDLSTNFLLFPSEVSTKLKVLGLLICLNTNLWSSM